MELGHKYRIYPTKKQRILIHKTFGCICFGLMYYGNKFNKNDLISKALKIMSEPKDADLLQKEKAAYENAMLLLKNNPDVHGIIMLN